MRGHELLDALNRQIGPDVTSNCLSKICSAAALDQTFHNQITNAEALAFDVYSTADAWHGSINEQLWSGNPTPDAVAFAKVLNSGLSKLIAIKGKAGTVYRGCSTDDLDAFGNAYLRDRIARFPGFTSGSFSEAVAFGGNALLIIRALSARSVWWLSRNFHEDEALLPADCSFQVIDQQFQSAGEQHVKLAIVLQETNLRPWMADRGDIDQNIAKSAHPNRISQPEADVIALFFASQPSQDWPASGLQRRMQASAGTARDASKA